MSSEEPGISNLETGNARSFHIVGIPSNYHHGILSLGDIFSKGHIEKERMVKENVYDGGQN